MSRGRSHVPWLLAWLLAAIATPSVLAQDSFIGGYNRALRDLLYACPIPIVENTSLLRTDFGRKAAGVGFQLVFHEVPAAVAEIAQASCTGLNEHFRGANVFLPNYTIQECTRAFQETMPAFVATQSAVCNESESVVRDKCRIIAPGKYCIIHERNFSANSYGNPEPEDKKLWCVLTRKEGELVEATCPPGFYCPGNGSDPLACSKGVTCPEGSTAEQNCPLGSMCLLPAAPVSCDSSEMSLLVGVNCQPEGNGKVVMPDTCDPGMVCQNGVPEECPAGKFCLEGTRNPQVCKANPDACKGGDSFPNLILMSIASNLGIIVAWALLMVSFTLKDEVIGRILIILWICGFWVAQILFEVAGSSPELGAITLLYTSMILWGGFLSNLIKKLIFEKLLVARLEDDALETLEGNWIWLDVCVAAALPSYILSLYHWTAALFMFLLVYTVAIGNFLLIYNARLRLTVFSMCISVFILFFFLWLTDGTWVMGSAGGLIICSSLVPFFLAVIRNVFVKPDKKKMLMGMHMLEAKQTIMRRASEVGDRMSRMRTQAIAASQALGATEVKPAIGITLKDMSLYLADGTSILNKISLVIPPSSFVGVMGPSGSGKSSITNVLSGRAGYGVVAGIIEINGDADIQLRSLASVTGFVPQDDVMHRELTCLENVAFQARLRMPRAYRSEGRGEKWAEEEAERMLEMFGLSHVKDSPIGDENLRGVSGGQRKRVSIAMELVSRPSLLFLDEPTSGLDSTTSHSVISLCAQNAHDTNCTTAAVIHQPRFETLMQFDYLILLGTGGWLTYAGSTKRVQQYFTRVLGVTFPAMANPADVLMDAMSLETAKVMVGRGTMKVDDAKSLKDNNSFGKYLTDSWTNNEDGYSPNPDLVYIDLPDMDPAKSSWGVMWSAQLLRAAVQALRNGNQIAFMNVLTVVGTSAVIFGVPRESSQLVFLQLSFAYLFLMLSQAMSAQRIFGGNERIVCWREAGVKVNTFWYFLGRDTVALVEVGMAASIFTLLYWPLGPVLCTMHQMYTATFCFVYATYGYSFLLSVLMDASSAQMVAVLLCFFCWFLGGLQPPLFQIANLMDGNGIYLLAVSPIRWVHGFLMHEHMETIALTGNQFFNPLLQYYTSLFFRSPGYDVIYIKQSGQTDWSCSGSWVEPVAERWSGRMTAGRIGSRRSGPKIGFNCNVIHLVLLGLLLRVMTILVLTANSKVKSRGGGSLFENKNSNSFFSNTFAPATNSLFFGLLALLGLVELFMMLQIP